MKKIIFVILVAVIISMVFFVLNRNQKNINNIENQIVEKDDNIYEYLVNKQNSLSKNYIPDNLITTTSEKDMGCSGNFLIQDIVQAAYDKMIIAAKEDGVTLLFCSGYRSYEEQEKIYNKNVEIYGKDAINKISAKPGYSEHQTGLAIDVSSNNSEHRLNTSFGSTIEGEWVENNAHKYGFIIRYPKEKENITKYNYEPWHLRYVGIEVATKIYIDEITLEEYLNEE